MADRFNADAVKQLFDQLVESVAGSFGKNERFNVVGIRTRGAILGDRLVARLRSMGYSAIDHGVIDVTMYRDDAASLDAAKVVRPTRLDVELDGKPLLLVDDVIFTGRSIRAALSLLMDFGRPAYVKLAVLVDRGGRELPIQPDFVSARLSGIRPTQRVNVRFVETDGRDAIEVKDS